MHILNPTDPREPVFRPGTIIHRACSFNRDFSAEPANVDFLTVSDGRMCRMQMQGNFIPEPEAHSNKVEKKTTAGVVVFVSGELPKDWTHLLITGVSRKMKQRRTEAESGKWDGRGCAVFAQFATPYNLDAYLRFRAQMAERWEEWSNSDLAGKIKVISEVQLPEVREGERRLAWSLVGDILHYAHIRLMTYKG